MSDPKEIKTADKYQVRAKLLRCIFIFIMITLLLPLPLFPLIHVGQAIPEGLGYSARDSITSPQ